MFVLLLGNASKKGLCHGCLAHFVNNVNYYTLKPLSIFSLAKILQLILEISPTYRLVTVICYRITVIYFKTMYNKTIIRFEFCDIRSNQGHGNCYQPRPSARLITLTSTLIIPDITKISSNNCLLCVLICC